MKGLIVLLFISTSLSLIAQHDQFEFMPNAEHPYGLPNPEMPEEHLDFARLIGKCNCQSVRRIDQNTWEDTMSMTWTFKYIMNGMGVQDETLKEDGSHSGSIRQYNRDSARWYVHYYSTLGSTPVLPVWEGNATEENKIVLYRDQAAPNGTPGKYKITFLNISEEGFDWIGEWVSTDESFVYPTWKIYCKKEGNSALEKDHIIQKAKAFSEALMTNDYESVANSYTTDAKIFPPNKDIVSGRTSIHQWWILPEGSSIEDHKLTPLEINILGEYAYDFGLYAGKSKNKKGEVFPFQGKYVVVWKKENGEWKMYLDIWNSRP